MSWEEFKRKKKNEIGGNGRILNSKDDEEKTASSWQKFKEEKERLNKISALEHKENDKKSILDDAGYIYKNLKAGFKGALTGAAKSVTTEIQNNLEKGENEKKSLLSSAGNLYKTTNPGVAIIMDGIENSKKLLEDKKSSIPQKIVKGTMDSVSSLLNNTTPLKRGVDEAIQMIGKNNPDTKNIIKNLDEKISEPYNKLQKEIAEESQQYSKATQLFGNVANVVGNMGPSIALTAVTKNPTIGLAAMGVSAKGQATQEALNKGADLDEAIKIGNTKGMIEVGTEMLSGGVNIFGKGALDDIVEKGIMNKVKSKVGKFLAKEGYDFAGEVGEEAISDVLGTIIDKGTVDPNARYSVSDFGDTAVTTILSTTVLKALGVPLNKAMNKNIEDQSQNIKTENEQKVYDSEVQKKKSERIRNNTIEKTYQEQIKTQEKLGVKITDEVKSKIKQNVEKAYDEGNLKPTELKRKELLSLEQEVEDDMQNGNISMENIMNVLGENKDISKDNLLMKSAYENEQKYNSYQFEKTDNEKVNNLLQSAVDSGINNTNKARKKVELISKLTSDTNKQYKFVSQEQLKQMGYNENANGLVDKSTGEILLNTSSFKEINAVVGHETTHLFDGKDKKGNYTKEYQTLQDMTIEYAKTKGIYDSKIQDITEAYGDLLVDENQVKEELTADLVGDFLFNDEKFIEHLATKDRNIFQKIYDYVKHVYKMITAKTDDAKALEKMKYQFDKVYKSISNENNTDIKYSIAGKEGVQNAIKADVSNLKLERNYNKAQQMKKIGIDNETIRQSTSWFQDKNGDWKFEFSDKDMALKNIILKKDKTYKLGEILKHDILFTAYPELANYDVKILSNTKANGSFNRFKNTINIKSELVKSNKSLEGTLIHEIQHAIQDIEGFERGRNSKGSKLAYYESLGEIEASDTKNRFVQEKYKGIDLTNVAPESSKANPKHSKLNEYLKNRSIVDKIKDGIYNYYNNGGNSNEINQEIIFDNTEQNNSLVDGGKPINKKTEEYTYIVRQNKKEKGSENNSDSFSLDKNLNQKYSMTKSTQVTGDGVTFRDILVQNRPSIEDKVRTKQEEIKNNVNIMKENINDNDVIENKEIDERLNKNKGKMTRKEVQEDLLREMNIKEEDLASGEDISSFNFQVSDPIRANEKVFGREIGKKINDAVFNVTKHNTAEKIRWQNREREDIKKLGIKARSNESAAVQKYGEKKYIDEYGKERQYGNAELARDFPDVKTQDKIKNAAKVIREKYDKYIEQINNTLTSMGYNPINKRDDYFRHFEELTDKFSQAGIPLNLNDMKAEDLPTDINGLTEFNKPGKSWFASAMERTGEKTNYDAITGIDGYLEGAGNIIFHTEDIQRYRALSRMIRETYGRTHGLDNIENMTDEQVAKRFEDIKDNKLSKYVAWLDEQANSLSGKKGAIDRGIERMLGRRAYTLMNTAKKQVGSNMTGFNVRSALTNLISSTLAASKTNKVSFAQGTIATVNNMFHNDGFIDKSDFLTSRFGSDILSQKVWQKASNMGQIFMNATDYFTANQIVRGKYYEGLHKGMTEDVAIKYADDFAARVMGDRAQGSTAEIFNSKTLGLFTQFQLEVNNQWQFMIHDTKMDFQQNAQENSGLMAGATMVWQLGQMAAYSYMFNELFEKITGSRAAFDPIEIIKTLFGLGDGDDDKSWEERIIEANSQLIDNLPFASMFTGGRIPVQEAYAGVSTLGKKLIGGKNEYGNEITWNDVKKDMLDSSAYWILPTGYSQLKKTVKGSSMYLNEVPGSYTNKGNLRYTVDDNVGSKAKSAIFGAYANPYAQDYIDSGYKTIKKEDIDEMVGLDMNSTEYRQYKKELSNASNTKDKNGYKQYIDEKGNTYWYDSGTETMYDKNYKKTTLTADDLTKVSKKEEALNYINGLDLTNSQKTIAANILVKNSKKNIDMSEYGKYSSYEEYKYARDYPEKYNVISQITDYDSFEKYKKDISDIKKQYSTEAGYESKERKQAIQSYINDLDLNVGQKMMLEKMAGGYNIKNYKNSIYEYLESTDLSEKVKYNIWKELFE